MLCLCLFVNSCACSRSFVVAVLSPCVSGLHVLYDQNCRLHIYYVLCMAAGDLFPVSKPCVEKAGAPKSHNHLFIPIVRVDHPCRQSCYLCDVCALCLVRNSFFSTQIVCPMQEPRVCYLRVSYAFYWCMVRVPPIEFRAPPPPNPTWLPPF